MFVPFCPTCLSGESRSFNWRTPLLLYLSIVLALKCVVLCFLCWLLIVACLLTSGIVKPAETAIDRKWLADTPIGRQWLSSRHVMAATDTHAAIEELLEAVFSVESVLMLYNEDHLSLRELYWVWDAVRRVGGSCEDVSPRAEDRPRLEDVTKLQWRPWLGTLVCDSDL
jgi:hypothetical protein